MGVRSLCLKNRQYLRGQSIIPRPSPRMWPPNARFTFSFASPPNSDYHVNHVTGVTPVARAYDCARTEAAVPSPTKTWRLTVRRGMIASFRRNSLRRPFGPGRKPLHPPTMKNLAINPFQGKSSLSPDLPGQVCPIPGQIRPSPSRPAGRNLGPAHAGASSACRPNGTLRQ